MSGELPGGAEARPGPEPDGLSVPEAWRGATGEAWAIALGVPRLELHGELPSTSDRLRDLAREGAPGGTVVVAESQTRGRGRSGRRWHSGRGAGLWLSVLVRPDAPGPPALLPLVAGVATARALERFASGAILLKWPNDLLVGARKVAGILCETVTEGEGGVVVGVGINLRPPEDGMPPELDGAVAFLEAEAGRTVKAPELAAALLQEIRGWFGEGMERMTGRLREEWDRRDGLRGRRIHLEDGRTGLARGIAEDGALEWIDEEGAVQRMRSGSVRLQGEGRSPALDRFPPGRTNEREGGWTSSST